MSEEGAIFEFRTISIALESGPQEGVAAFVHGALAVCETYDHEWRLTHAATGFLIARFGFWFDACKAAVRLADADWANVMEKGHPSRAETGALVKRVVEEVLREARVEAMIDPFEIPS